MPILTPATTDLFQKVGLPGSATTLSSPGYTIGNNGITVSSTTNHPTDTLYTFAIDRAQTVNGVTTRIAGTYCEFEGMVSSATTITSMALKYGTSQNYPAGSFTRVYIPVSSNRENQLIVGLRQDHSGKGNHQSLTDDNGNTWLERGSSASAVNQIKISNGAAGTAPSIAANGSDTNIDLILTPKGTGKIKLNGANDGWSPLNVTLSGGVYNGNRSYNFNTSADLTGIVSPGMRLMTTRTVAAPTQCTSLNGSTQYYSKTTPAGMTFTNNFVVSAWVKVSSYATSGSSVIMSRYNGTSGWNLDIDTAGCVRLFGYNASSANFSAVVSAQSVPLNKWVHIAAQLDMSTFTATTTTSYVMIDGVNVPATVSRGGTNPTALVQAGNLEVGSFNGGTRPFAGKIAQAAVFSAKVTQATMQTYVSQGLAGTETSLVSAYSFNNSINDLNTTNANNLTANGSAVATNTDAPFTVQASGVPNGTTDYGIITAVSSTSITSQVAEGCAIPTTGGVTSVSYSSVKAPYGFPSWTNKWRVTIPFKVQVATTSNINFGTYNSNGMAITVPVGSWVVGAALPMFNATATRIVFNLSSTTSIIGVAAGSEDLTWSTAVQAAAAATAFNGSVVISNPVDLAAATAFIIYTCGATTSGGLDADNQKCELFAECAYL